MGGSRVIRSTLAFPFVPMHRFHQGDHAFGDQFGGIGVVPLFEGLRHRGMHGFVRQETQDERGEGFAGRAFLFEQEGGAGFNKGIRVVELMVVGGGRIRNQNGRELHRGDLSERGGSGAADGNIRRAEREFHLGEKRADDGSGFVRDRKSVV